MLNTEYSLSLGSKSRTHPFNASYSVGSTTTSSCHPVVYRCKLASGTSKRTGAYLGRIRCRAVPAMASRTNSPEAPT